MNAPTASPVEFRFFWSLAAAMGIAAVCAASTGVAADAEVETLLSDLHEPRCVAIRGMGADASGYEILVYEIGADRIVSFPSDEPGRATKVITGLESREGSGALAVLDANRLVVSGGEALLRMYSFPAPGETVPANEPEQTVSLAEDSEASAGHVSALARTRANQRVPDMLILALVGDDRRGQLWKVPLRADTFGDAAPFGDVSTDEANAVSALTVSGQGFLVSAEKRVADDAEAMQLTFYSPVDGSRVLSLALELREIAALAYSPLSGNLYAAGTGPRSDGVFRIDDASRDGKPACVAVKIAEISRPTSLAFGPDGLLYVTTSGTEPNRRQGALQRVTGDL